MSFHISSTKLPSMMTIGRGLLLRLLNHLRQLIMTLGKDGTCTKSTGKMESTKMRFTEQSAPTTVSMSKPELYKNCQVSLPSSLVFLVDPIMMLAMALRLRGQLPRLSTENCTHIISQKLLENTVNI